MASLRTISIANASRIQALALALPDILCGKKNKVIISSNGTGKTLLFAIAIVSHVDTQKDGPQVLCLDSTYEAAIQIANVLYHVAMLTSVKIGTALKDSRSKFHSFIETFIMHFAFKKYLFFSRFIPKNGLSCDSWYSKGSGRFRAHAIV